MLYDSPTNQQFPVLPDSWYNAGEKYAMTQTGKPDAAHCRAVLHQLGHQDEDVDALLADVAGLIKHPLK